MDGGVNPGAPGVPGTGTELPVRPFSLKEILALAIVIAGLGWLSSCWAANTWAMWIVKSGVFFILVNLYCLLLYHRNSGFKELLFRLKERIGR